MFRQILISINSRFLTIPIKLFPLKDKTSYSYVSFSYIPNLENNILYDYINGILQYSNKTKFRFIKGTIEITVYLKNMSENKYDLANAY